MDHQFHKADQCKAKNKTVSDSRTCDHGQITSNMNENQEEKMILVQTYYKSEVGNTEKDGGMLLMNTNLI